MSKNTKKIADSVNIRINVGNYEHIDLTKYAEKVIEYESQEEMVKKEDELTEEIIVSLIRTMKKIPERLGKKTDAVEKFEDSVKKTIPSWLESGVEPNIANAAKSNYNKNVAEQDSKVAKKDEEVDKLLNPVETTNDTPNEGDSTEELVDISEEDLFK